MNLTLYAPSCLELISRFFNGLILCLTSRSVLSSRDVRRFKDVRKEFERSSECLEGAQARNAQAPRGKQHEIEEASNALLNARKAFRSEALDYVLEVRKNAGWSKKSEFFSTLSDSNLSDTPLKDWIS